MGPSLEAPSHRTGLSPGLVLVFAVACGLAVANLYYAQPILDTIAKSFHTSSATAGLVVTLSQIGYAVGLALLVPLGDLVSRRRLVPLVLTVTTGGLIASALAPVHRGAHRGRPRRRRRIGRGPGARPDGGVPGKRRAPRPGRGHGHERPAHRHPACPNRVRCGGGRHQLAGGLRRWPPS